jgi:hypothetical protein
MAFSLAPASVPSKSPPKIGEGGMGDVYRDLKPANSKVRPDGAVKVLDFELAKAMEPAGAAAASPALPRRRSPRLR